MTSNLVFASNTILSCFVFFFLIPYLYLLIPAVITKIFIAISELAIPTEIPTNKARAEIGTHPVTVEARISKFSIYFKILQVFLCFLLINSFCFVSSMN